MMGAGLPSLTVRGRDGEQSGRFFSDNGEIVRVRTPQVNLIDGNDKGNHGHFRFLHDPFLIFRPDARLGYQNDRIGAFQGL